MLLIVSQYSRTELQILKGTDDNSLAWDMEKAILGEKHLNNREEQVDSKREDQETRPAKKSQRQTSKRQAARGNSART